jgi:serine phosphatase RsbU (regulator of sigma subunit)/pSer/pThr/pTyr-binding forkhead associated (FHA) protein
MAYLESKSGFSEKETFPLPCEVTVLGRHPYCEIVLDQGAVSREHARILHESDDFFLEDLHSRNGTFLNGHPIDQKQAIHDGDEIRICDLVFSFRNEEERARERASSPSSSTTQAVLVEDDSVDSTLNITSRIDVGNQSGLGFSSNPAMKLQALVDIGRNLGNVLDMEKVIPILLKNLLAIFRQADCASIVLKDPRSGRLELKGFKHRNPRSKQQFRISLTVLEAVVSSKSAILSDDVANDSRFDVSDSIVNFQLRSVMSVPLLDADQEVLGVIQVDSRKGGSRFSHNDLDVLASVASQAGAAIENARLHARAIEEKKFDHEMGVAHKVQKGFLPVEPPHVKQYGFFDYYQPAKFLGGDYFDYIPLPEDRLAIALGDVSGKGISAALLMAKLSAECRYSLIAEPGPVEAVARMNRLYCESRWDDRFITFILAVLDINQHRLTLVNAGHLSPLLRQPDGEVIDLADTFGGLPLGVMPDADFGEFEMSVEPGQVIALFSDGLPDAMNNDGECYSLESVRKQLRNIAGASVDEIGPRLIGAVRSFAGRQPQTDDQCLVLFGRER